MFYEFEGTHVTGDPCSTPSGSSAPACTSRARTSRAAGSASWPPSACPGPDNRSSTSPCVRARTWARRRRSMYSWNRWLASGVPHAQVINAAFTYAHPLGSRFNSADRGAWYVAFQLTTAQAEVAFHKTVHLAEVGRYEDEVELDDYLADFSGEFHDLRRAKRLAACLDPASYVSSQTLAEMLLESGSPGVAYPSVRRRRGTCLACFDPKRVANVRRGARCATRSGPCSVPPLACLEQECVRVQMIPFETFAWAGEIAS